MTLGAPTAGGTYESQQFGPAPSTTGWGLAQPAMYGYDATVANWQPYKGWAFYPHLHNGLDVAGPEGTYLRALEAGTVTFAGLRNNGGGIVVEVTIRPGTRYAFNHCSAALVKVGQKVAKGQNIARIGHTGVATGNHCHVGLEILERGPDGLYRWLSWNPKRFMAGGAYAGDARVAPLVAAATVPRLSSGITADGVNIRSTPRLTAAAVYGSTSGGRIYRRSDGADLGLRTARFRYYRVVQGDTYNAGGRISNRWVEIYLGGGHRFIAEPFASAVRYYAS